MRARPSRPGTSRKRIAVTYFVTLMERVNRLVAEALEAAALAVEELAVRAGLSSSALRRYRLGDRTPSPDVLRRLAKELRRQGKRLERLAHTLETEAERGGNDA